MAQGRPLAGPLVVCGSHLHLIDGAGRQVGQVQRGAVAVVAGVLEFFRGGFAVPDVVVGDRRPQVVGLGPANSQTGRAAACHLRRLRCCGRLIDVGHGDSHADLIGAAVAVLRRDQHRVLVACFEVQ